MSQGGQLFGGAITMDLPSDFIDASDLRQVPDNQEVYLSPDSYMSLVLEILECVDTSDGEDAVKFHFDALAYDNSAISQKILDISLQPEPQVSSPPATPYPTILTGEQEVRKFNCTIPDQVLLLMALYRIKSKGVDLVLTGNIPGKVGNKQLEEDSCEKYKRVFNAAAKSLKIVDFGLFA